ncbi:MAG: aminotransferase class I/II-fold pyridoxal phosphate-dependent enzyme [Thaumarchaeota archaeon]|nr:aminotransferase class I/II-fold pyridoxal phosphate-dependent enzyme [Nitrososphaerota archaeon]
MHNVRNKGPYIYINNKKLLNLCSNDYLGLSRIRRYSDQLQTSSRLVAGNDTSFNIFEKKLARHKSQERSLIFPTGYMANLGAISTIVRENDVIFSDELNHASIIEACRLTRAKVLVYKHNNIDDLISKIKQESRRKFVATEGVFSMDGDIANLKQISEITEKTNSILILDDAHGDFTLGTDGKGTANHFKISKKIDLYVSSLSKGLGSFGGYVASQNNVIELLINRSKPFIYTSALPSFLVKDAMQKFDSNREKQQEKLQQNTNLFRNGLENIGYDINSITHIIPIIIGKEKTALEFGKYLFKKGIFAQPIRYPTVSKNKARIRLSVTAWLEKNQIEKALDVFEMAGKKFQII